MGSASASGSATTRAPEPLKASLPVRRFVWATAAAVLFFVVFPHLPFVSFSIVVRANLAGQYALIAISLVVLTGWVGQVSLGQAAFVGVGAYVTGIAVQSWGLGFPLVLVVGAAFGALAAAALGTVALRVRGLYLAVATLIFSWTADAFLFQQEWLTRHSFIELNPIGEPGAVPHLDFTDQTTFYYAVWAVVGLVIFCMANLRDRRTGRAFFAVRGSEMAAASLGIDVVRTKLLAFAVSGALAGIAGSLMIVGSQVVTADQFNLESSLFFVAIAVVGGLTSLPGAVASGMLFAGLEEVFFRVPSIGNYLTLVSAVLLAAVLLLYPGGLAALGRTVGARSRHLWARYREMRRRLVSDDLAGVGSTGPEGDGTPAEAVEAVEAVVPQPDARPPGEGAAGRPSLLAPLRNRLAPVLGGVRSSFDRWLMLRQARRQIESSSATLDFGRLLAPDLEPSMPEPAELEVEEPPDASTNGHHAPGATASWETEAIAPVELPPRPRRRPLIEVAGVTVRFGGLTAVSGFSMSVREGEIVGLIGPNGAGKTTSFNSIAGFNTPAEGRVQLHGADVTPLPVYLRSRLGVARTFQVIQLFPQLDVFDNLLVATYIADRGSFFSDMFMLNRALSEELKARRRVEDVIRLLDLADVAHRGVSELPFGVLRMVEIARALVTGAPVIMLDEPASGLDDLETERLTQLVRYLRSLGVTILLIEHDVKMVTSVSDYMYVLDQGTPIAEGTPDEIQRNPAVIAAYLGEETEETEETESQPASVRS